MKSPGVVYVLSHIDYDNTFVRGVYETREAAERDQVDQTGILKSRRPDQHDEECCAIEEFEVRDREAVERLEGTLG